MLAKGTPIWLISIPMLSIVSFSIYFLLEEVYFVLLGALILVSFIPVLAFFRDPERTIGEGVVSPADGIVTRIEEDRGWVDISIFMNVHNVHVNRMPDSGRILSVEHISGGYVPAFNKDSDRNERYMIEVQTNNGKWRITQIAGAVARRIVPYVEPGDTLEKGSRFGMIRFGSRVDLRFKVPIGQKISVKVGDKVLAGISSLSR
jgi:phosphatidylserine decarboxylase